MDRIAFTSYLYCDELAFKGKFLSNESADLGFLFIFACLAKIRKSL